MKTRSVAWPTLAVLAACSGNVESSDPHPGGASPSGLPSSEVPAAVTPTEGAPGPSAANPSTAPGAGPPGTASPTATGAVPPSATAAPGEPGNTPGLASTPPAPANPGTVAVRRLNHSEYDNTVLDLLGTTLTPARDFLADDPGDGFDTVGAAASLSPAYVRDYAAAAEALIDDLYADEARLAEVVSCDVETEGVACADAVLSSFAARAFRRPVDAAEVAILRGPYDAALDLGAPGGEGLHNALVAVLMSPHFIFKVEVDPDPTSTAPHRLTDYELATRLSYALWSTMPDDLLLAAAESGALSTDAGLASEIDRMLADPRSQALADDFAAQWLDFRNLGEHQVDPSVQRDFGPELVASMQREAKTFFLEFLTGDHQLSELLGARFSFVDPTLAAHYGLSDPGTGEELWQVEFSDQPRAGLLTLGAVLTATSYSTRTSPVRRGQFVLDRLLCSAVPPPPPEIEGLMEDGEGPAVETLTLRERMELHRQDPMCISCHELMDPIGFGLDTFDAVGRYRVAEAGQPIDSSGTFGGQPFEGAVELAGILSSDTRFEHCLTEKWMTYALGRFVNQVDDDVWIAHLAGTVADGQGTLAELVKALLMSEAFRSRQAVVPSE